MVNLFRSFMKIAGNGEKTVLIDRKKNKKLFTKYVCLLGCVSFDDQHIYRNVFVQVEYNISHSMIQVNGSSFNNRIQYLRGVPSMYQGLLRVSSVVIISFSIFFLSCGGGGGGDSSSSPAPPSLKVTAPCDVDLTWEANKEKSVNRAGGGYRVYLSDTQGFDIGSVVPEKDVPYVSDDIPASTSTSISFAESDTGTWYLKVVGYGLISGSEYLSQPSDEISILVE